jgi:hypothetical protein
MSEIWYFYHVMNKLIWIFQFYILLFSSEILLSELHRCCGPVQFSLVEFKKAATPTKQIF